MANEERRNWKIIIGMDRERNSENYVYGVTYGEACASAERQIEGNMKALGYVVIEA